jgi:hypothetical protein
MQNFSFLQYLAGRDLHYAWNTSRPERSIRGLALILYCNDQKRLCIDDLQQATTESIKKG